MNKIDIKKRILAAENLLAEETTTIEKVKSIYSLLHGINPRLDTILGKSLRAVNDVEKLQKGEVIELTLTNLPEKTEEQKKRKKAIVFLINTFKDLRTEVERVRSELDNFQKENPNGKAESAFKVIYSAKGILGITTIVAVLIVGALIATNALSKKDITPIASEKSKTKVIIFNGKQIPLTNLRVGKGTECDQDEHYHALDHEKALAIDGTTVYDPGGCGFGKVKDVEIVEIE